MGDVVNIKDYYWCPLCKGVMTIKKCNRKSI